MGNSGNGKNKATGNEDGKEDLENQVEEIRFDAGGRKKLGGLEQRITVKKSVKN